MSSLFTNKLFTTNEILLISILLLNFSIRATNFVMRNLLVNNDDIYIEVGNFNMVFFPSIESIHKICAAVKRLHLTLLEYPRITCCNADGRTSNPGITPLYWRAERSDWGAAGKDQRWFGLRSWPLMSLFGHRL